MNFKLEILLNARVYISGGFIMDQIKEWLPFIIPLVIAELILLAVTIRHILTHDNYKRGSRPLWLLVTIIGMEFIGPILYFTLGKGEDE